MIIRKFHTCKKNEQINGVSDGDVDGANKVNFLGNRSIYFYVAQHEYSQDVKINVGNKDYEI
jgi:glucose/arabinose dehydrogenase